MTRAFPIAIICIATATAAFAQLSGRARLDDLNKRLEHAEKMLDWPEAEKIAAEVLEISSQEIGRKTRETAHAHFVISLLQKQVGKFAESNESLIAAREILEGLPESDQADLVSIYSELGFQNFNAGRRDLAKRYYLQALEKADRSLGERQAESFLPLINLANIGFVEKDYSTVNQYHIKAYFVALERLGPESGALNKLRRSRICSDIESHLSKKEINAFYDVEKQSPNFKHLHEGIINGKAKSLPMPAYPLLAKSSHIGGRVWVQVLIDETGKVTDTDFVCGEQFFADTVIQAARKARFDPTLLNGKPIMVTGFIMYNFVP